MSGVFVGVSIEVLRTTRRREDEDETMHQRNVSGLNRDKVDRANYAKMGSGGQLTSKDAALGNEAAPITPGDIPLRCCGNMYAGLMA